ncbi:MAG: VWA domain-containing protein, partial [Devosia sp.]
VTAWFLLDLSPSVDFGSGDTNKRQVLSEFVGIVARLLTRQGNKVGAVLYDGVNSFVVPPRGGRQQVLYMLERIAKNPRLLHTPRTDISRFIGGAFSALKRRSLVFVVSDFISNPGWDKALLALTRRHEVLAVRLVDPVDGDIPDIGMLQFEDSETGETVFVDTGDAGFRRRYADVAEQNEHMLLDAFTAAGTDVLELSTDDDLVDAIRRFADLKRMQQSLNTGAAMPAHLGAPTEEMRS